MESAKVKFGLSQDYCRSCPVANLSVNLSSNPLTPWL